VGGSLVPLQLVAFAGMFARDSLAQLVDGAIDNETVD
jgi:hypothetical protein